MIGVRCRATTRATAPARSRHALPRAQSRLKPDACARATVKSARGYLVICRVSISRLLTFYSAGRPGGCTTPRGSNCNRPWLLPLGAVYEVGDGDVSCPLQLQEYVESRAGVVREISCDTGGADSLPVRPCEGLCARQEGRPNNSPPTVKSENKTTRRRYQEKKVKECISKIA